MTPEQLAEENRQLRRQLQEGAEQVKGIIRALLAMAKDAQEDGYITPMVRQSEDKTRALILEGLRKGRVPNLAVPSVRLELQHIVAFWTCLNYYTKGLIPQQPFTLAPDSEGFRLLPGISLEEKVKP